MTPQLRLFMTKNVHTNTITLFYKDVLKHWKTIRPKAPGSVNWSISQNVDIFRNTRNSKFHIWIMPGFLEKSLTHRLPPVWSLVLLCCPLYPKTTHNILKIIVDQQKTKQDTNEKGMHGQAIYLVWLKSSYLQRRAIWWQEGLPRKLSRTVIIIMNDYKWVLMMNEYYVPQD